MDGELTSDISDDVYVVDKMRMNLKSHADMIDPSTSKNFFNNISANRGLVELKDNSDEFRKHQLESIDLIANDREVPDFLGHSDDEDFTILSYPDSVTMWSRSTQTCGKDTKNESRTLRGHTINYPATVGNGELSNTRVSSAIPFYQELMLTRSQLNSIHHNYETMKTRFYRLHADYEKLMGIAAELTTSLENSVRGQTVDLRATLQACMKIYPEFFNQNVRNNDKLQSSAAESEIDYLDKNLRISMLSTVPLSAKDLNYKKIKLHLIHGNIRTKLLLLQALRWKITLSQPGERDEAIIEYIHNDLLGIHGQIAGDSGKSILPYILIPLDIVVPHPVQQSAARLLNTFASFKCGRDYLAVGPNVLNVVIQCLDSTQAESIDAFTCDMIIATLQKLSLRKHQRLYMISAGIIEWLIHHLKADCHSMGTYRLEYATALLMNLSLHKEAQIRGAAIAMMLVSTLIALLSLQHLPALPYVYGALNNFLANSAINEEANAIGLKSILEHHRNYRTGELRKHLDDILLRYRRKFNHTIEEETHDAEDREENDILEDELDDMDSVKVHAGELFGEGLLATCYLNTPYVKSRDDHKFTNGSSSDVSYKTGDDLNEREDQRLFKDRYSSFHSQRLSPRESSVTAVNSGMNASSTILDSAFGGADVAEERISSIASL